MTMPRQPGREPEHEQQLLAHFRQHSQDEPSPALDARILAAAREASRQPSPSRWLRLWRWFGAGGTQPRWPLALAGVACLGIGLSLTWRNLDQAPQTFDAPVAPMTYSAPAPQAKASAVPPPMEAAKRQAAPVAARIQAESAPLADAAELAEQRAEAPPAEPEHSLKRLLELRRDGRKEEAERLHRQLQRDYPKLDIEAELKRLNDAP
ncbi:hypothetical protein [Zestomonas carbonaria]|uniref:Uncharacterized protein n=1 Tax=Zestomonas carbonaria TaxID=2762745 RepID=A0A7U7ES89_9GAMM|nr:hypothetical protein [Pseudomonas carbonaria]CAD5110145.1 hypothetical protein PSEWESI4_04462 [Pseudomonas carbonaria]